MPTYGEVRLALYRLLRVAVGGALAALLTFGLEAVSSFDAGGDATMVAILIAITALLNAAAKWAREKGLITYRFPL